MALAVNIDFENVYEITPLSNDLRETCFNTVLQDGTQKMLKVEISNESHELMPDVYNLAFGPLDARGRIDDKAELPHNDYSKVFSTILLDALTYLTKNRNHYIGIDGSDLARAIYYFRMIQRNYETLTAVFNVFGLKYYVRINRFGKQQYHNPFDFNDVFVQPKVIEHHERLNSDTLYNYYIFSLK